MALQTTFKYRYSCIFSDFYSHYIPNYNNLLLSSVLSQFAFFFLTNSHNLLVTHNLVTSPLSFIFSNHLDH